MCGFAGIISDGNVQHLCVEKMIDTIGYRGPDDKYYAGVSISGKGIYTQSQLHKGRFRCVAGFARLSIRDLSDAGKQPMVDGGIILSFVGEIYNAVEMRAELIKLGDHFTGKSDTEIILKWYKKFGIDNLINILNGMYAIALIIT